MINNTHYIDSWIISNEEPNKPDSTKLVSVIAETSIGNLDQIFTFYLFYGMIVDVGLTALDIAAKPGQRIIHAVI